MDRERLVDELLMLLPVLGRELGRPDPAELKALARRGVPMPAQLSPGARSGLDRAGEGSAL